MPACDELQTALLEELNAAGLIPDRREYEEGRSEVVRLGRSSRECVVRLVGRRTWRQAMRRMERTSPDEDAARVLGFGQTLTRFCVAPVGGAASSCEELLFLGALANFIVSTFDQLVDGGSNPRLLLPAWMLKSLAHRGMGLRTRLISCTGGAAARMLHRLVAEYFTRLDHLAYARVHTDIVRSVKKAIFRMYRAERQTLARDHERVPQHVLFTKAALPFVVMGLPAWLTVPTIEPHHYLSHVRWLYLVGDLFGTIDEAVDMDQDVSAGSPNRVAEELSATDGNGPIPMTLARNIAQRGAWVMSEWDSRIAQDRLSAVSRAAFGTCLLSWLGGVSRLP